MAWTTEVCILIFFLLLFHGRHLINIVSVISVKKFLNQESFLCAFLFSVIHSPVLHLIQLPGLDGEVKAPSSLKNKFVSLIV